MRVVHIVIMGCGRVGSRLAQIVARAGHDVAVIDRDVDAFRRLGHDFTGDLVKGVGFDRAVLVEAGIEKADGFAAVASGDNSNILAARVVRETFEIDNVVARIYDPGRAEVYERLGIPTVATVKWSADQVLRRLIPDGSAAVWRDQSGRATLAQVWTHASWVGREIGAIQRAIGCPVPFLVRLGQGIVTQPSMRFQDGDLLHVAVATERLAEVETLLATPAGKD